MVMKMAAILFVDDEPAIREMLGTVLGVEAPGNDFTLLNNDTALADDDTYYWVPPTRGKLGMSFVSTGRIWRCWIS